MFKFVWHTAKSKSLADVDTDNQDSCDLHCFAEREIDLATKLCLLLNRFCY